MDLLQDHPKDFRYYLCTSTSNNIYILFSKFAYEIKDNEETPMENVYIHTAKEVGDEFINSETVKVTEWNNEVTIDQFHLKVYEYIKARKDRNINKIKFMNFSLDDNSILFPDNVFQIATECCKKIYVQLENCGLRISGDKLNNLEELKWQSGTLFVGDETPVIKCNVFKSILCKVDTHVKENEKKYCNIVAETKCSIVNMQTMSAIKMNILGNPEDQVSFAKSKLTINTYTIFGEEFDDIDKNEPRLTISKFKSCVCNEIIVENAVKYGKIVDCDLLNSFTLLRFVRNINPDTNPGIPITIGSVASTSLSFLEIFIDKKHNLLNESSLITFKPDNTGLLRKIKIFNTHVINEDEMYKFYLIGVGSMHIVQIFVSDCIFDPGMNVIKTANDTYIEKLFISKCKINSKDNIKYDHINKISLSETEISTIGSIQLPLEKISIETSTFRFNKFIVSNEKDPTIKFSTQSSNFYGKEILIDNPMVDYCFNMYDTKSRFEVNKIQIKGFNATLDNSCIQSEVLDLYGDFINKLLNPIIKFTNKKQCTINMHSTFNGTIMFTDENLSDCVLTLNINDEVKTLSNENLTIDCMLDSPGELYINTDDPVNMTLMSFSNKTKVHMVATDKYDDELSCEFTCLEPNPTDEIQTPIVLNDSEQRFELSSRENEYGSKDFIFTPK